MSKTPLLAITVALASTAMASVASANDSAAIASPRLAKVWVQPTAWPQLKFRFSPRPPSCERTAQPATVRVVMRWRTEKGWTEVRWCVDTPAGVRLDVEWSDRGTNMFESTTSGDGVLSLGPNFEGTATRDYTYRVFVDGQLLRTGRVRVKSKRLGNRVIWEDEDDFVNVCINQNLTVWKSGGRLYCVEALGTNMNMTLLSSAS